MAEPTSQTALFEDDYLLRELGQVAYVPQVADRTGGERLGCRRVED